MMNVTDLSNHNGFLLLILIRSSSTWRFCKTGRTKSLDIIIMKLGDVFFFFLKRKKKNMRKCILVKIAMANTTLRNQWRCCIQVYLDQRYRKCYLFIILKFTPIQVKEKFQNNPSSYHHYDLLLICHEW
jgi:hypothetical protein